MIQLYDYQEDGVKQIRSLFAKGFKRVLYQLPTGGGKTIVFSYITHQAVLKNKRILIISHRIELLIQSGGTLEKFMIKPFYITSKTKYPRDNNVYVAMTNTLKNRMKDDVWQRWFDSLDMIIIDECHRSEFAWIKPRCYKLGVTASPRRTGKMPQLRDEYDQLIIGLDTQELINKGRLVIDRYFGVEVDISGVGYDSEGEFNTSQLYEKYNKTELYSGLIDNWKRICPGTITIVFCCNIQHCVNTTLSLNAAGCSAKFLTSMPGKPVKGEGKAAETIYKRKLAEWEHYHNNMHLTGERSQVIAQWKAREFDILVNAGLFVEGFDHKPIQTVVVNLATTSTNKWLQMLGRGSRPYDNKHYFNILDFGLNANRLGHYRAQRSWSLTHSENKNEGVPPSKLCPKCHALIFASSKVCKYCGFEFPKTEQEKIAELVHVNYADRIPQKINFKNLTIAEIEEYGKQRDYNKFWLHRIIYNTFGRQGLEEYSRKKAYNPEFVEHLIKIYEP
jgi:superfamily II DNA or RNA helicase